MLPFVISRCCEILAIITCTFVLLLFSIRIHQAKKNRHSVAIDPYMQLHAYLIIVIVILQNGFNSTTSWIFVLVPSIKNQNDHSDLCTLKEYTNFTLTALFKLFLYQFFILRMRMALGESALKYPRCIVYCVRICVLIYCATYAYLAFTRAKIFSFESYNNGFDCYYQFEDIVLWGLGITDTLLSGIISYLFVRKLHQLHNLRELGYNDRQSRTSYYYNPSISRSSSQIYRLSLNDEEIMKSSMGKIKVSIHSALTAHDRYKNEKLHQETIYTQKIGRLPIKITILWLIQFVFTWSLYYLGYSTVLQFLGWFIPINGIIDVLCVYWCFRFNDEFFYGKCIPCLEQCYLCWIQCCCRFGFCCCCTPCYKMIKLDDHLNVVHENQSNDSNDYDHGSHYIPMDRQNGAV